MFFFLGGQAFWREVWDVITFFSDDIYFSLFVQCT